MNIPIDPSSSSISAHALKHPSKSFKSEENVSWFDLFLPPPAFPLLLLLFIIVPLALLATESLFVPLWEFCTSLLTSNAEGLSVTLPFHFFLKLAAFLILAFFGFVQLLLRVNVFYHAFWARTFDKPHPLHVPYQVTCGLENAATEEDAPHTPEISHGSVTALLNWKLYRLVSVLGPPVVLGAMTIGLGFLELSIFNLTTGFPFMSLSIQLIIAMFLFMVLSLFFALACLNACWTFIITAFGDVIAMTEPNLPVKTISERASRLAFASPMVYVYYGFYGLFALGVLLEGYLLLQSYTVEDFLTFQVNYPVLIGLELLTIVTYLALNYFRFVVYHQSLVNYYEHLPLVVKDRYAATLS